MAVLRCPYCNASFDCEQTEAMPFCSERCRSLDLYRWLTEKYSLPVEREEPSAEEADQSESGQT